MIRLILFLPLLIAFLNNLSHAQIENKFRVGAILPLSGPLAEYGVAAKNGIELAKEQHPDLFNRIEFDYEDSLYDPKTTILAFNKLVLSKRVSLVFTWGNPPSEAVAPIAENRDVPLLAVVSGSAIARGKTRLIRFFNPTSDLSKPLAQYLKQKGFKRLGVVTAENTYVGGILEGLKSNLASDQQLTTIATFNPTDMDFRSAVLKVKAQVFDAIGVFLLSGQVGTFYKQLQEHGVNTPSFGTDFFESTVEVGLAKGAMEGAIYPQAGVTSEFQTQYISKFKNNSQITHAGNSYDMAMLMGTLFNSLQTKLSPEEIMAELKSSRSSLTGAMGTMRFRQTADVDSYFEFPIILKKVQQGQFVRLEGY